MSQDVADARVQRLAAAYEALDASVERRNALLALYAPDARFVDPFNDVQGRDAIGRIFEHMNVQVRAPRFVVTESFRDGDIAWLRWDFSFEAAPGVQRCIAGASRIAFDSAGRVREHRDFWDPARGIYEHVPLLGALLRAIRRRLAAPQGAAAPRGAAR